MKTRQQILEKIESISTERDSGIYMQVEEKKLGSWILALKWVLDEVMEKKPE